MQIRYSRSIWIAAILFTCAGPAFAQVPVPLTIDGNDATGPIEIGLLEADLTIHFEQVEGLTPSAIAVTARIVGPLNGSLLQRLPTGVGLTSGFPVLVEITPPAAGGLAFRGVATVRLHTHNLEYLPGIRLVLYSAHMGGPFRDITRYAGSGSYRVDGGGGTFSEFLILLDPRPVDAIILEKFAALQQTLDGNAALIEPDTLADLAARLLDARAQFDAGNTADAIAVLDGFSAAVVAGSGSTIPDQWRADGTTVNAAGLLRAAADTLRFSLDWKLTH